MDAREFRKFLKAEPFVPFKIEISGGTEYLVRHPEFALVTHTTVALADQGMNINPPHIDPDENPDAIFDGLHVVAMDHVIRCIPMPALKKK